jgi:hypothetical protein
VQKDIQSVMQEDRVFPPSTEFRKQAVLKAPALERMYATMNCAVGLATN